VGHALLPQQRREACQIQPSEVPLTSVAPPGEPVFRPWLVIGMVATGMVLLNDLGRLLADTQAPGSPSFGAWVFTGPKFRFWDTAALQSAVELWGTLRKTAQPLLVLHVLMDAIFLIPWYWRLLRRALDYVGAEKGLASGLAIAVAIADAVETAMTGIVIAGAFTSSGTLLCVLQFLTLAKWILLSATLLTTIALWVNPTKGVSAKDLLDAIAEARAGGRRHPGIALLPIMMLVALFGALIAVPAGGPLEQLPDVIRYQLSGEGGLGLLICSGVALVLLASAVATGGLLAIDPDSAERTPGAFPRFTVLSWAAGLSLVLFGVACWVDKAPRSSPWSFGAVALTVTIAGWLADRGRKTESRKEALAESPFAWTSGEKSDRLWVGALSGLVIVAGGLALVRATFPLLVLNESGARTEVRWSAALVLGIVAALSGGNYVQRWIVKRSRMRSCLGLAPIWLPAGFAAVIAGTLAGVPARGESWGTTGVVAIGFSVSALVLGALRLAGRVCPLWAATFSLGFGRRTPWLTLLAITWSVASLLNTEGVYHDARVFLDPAPAQSRHESLRAAFGDWVEIQRACNPQDSAPLPLVLLAAPGGGIRAAYWTAATLDRLFDPGTSRCAGHRLFAISGVSGGSVGAATWLAARAADSTARNAVERMSRDDGLAAAAVGLLLRDAVQPFVGITANRLDRAALLENGWIRTSGVFGATKAPVRWRAFGRDEPWVPVVVFNASSVTDGCRVLVSNVSGLPASTSNDCGTYSPGSITAGPVSASIDPFPRLYPRSREGAGCGKDSTDMRLVTAALLSARFPLVTPSGALIRCFTRDTAKDLKQTYVVDGGYFENSGLLTVLQIWQEIEPQVREHNRSAANARRRIVPWIVVADNHYREQADAPVARRPLELLVFYQTLKGNRLFSQGSLEQQANVALGHSPECGRAMSSEPGPEALGCFVVIAPTRKPAVAAPLGWVLSPTSRTDLNNRLDSLLPKDRAAPDPILAELLRQLR
jgi:hypothetical protein